MSVDHLAIERLVETRIESHDLGEEVVERPPLDEILVGVGDGRDLQERAEPRERGILVVGHHTSLRRAPRSHTRHD